MSSPPDKSVAASCYTITVASSDNSVGGVTGTECHAIIVTSSDKSVAITLLISSIYFIEHSSCNSVKTSSYIIAYSPSYKTSVPTLNIITRSSWDGSGHGPTNGIRNSSSYGICHISHVDRASSWVDSIAISSADSIMISVNIIILSSSYSIIHSCYRIGSSSSDKAKCT